MVNFHWTQLNTEAHDMNNPTNKDSETLATELSDKIGKILEDSGIENCILLYELPGDSDESPYRSFRRGHFYDTLKIVGAYVQSSKQRIAMDLDGIA